MYCTHGAIIPMIDDLYELLARFGFQEPLHSPITHMPIGLAVGAFIFFLVAVFFKRKNLVLTARHASILAFIFVFPTILLGVFDWVHFYHATLFTPIKIKMGLATFALLFLGAGIILGSEIKLHTTSMTLLYAATCIVMVGLGYFGAGIIYGRGLEIKPPRHESSVSVEHALHDSLVNNKGPLGGGPPNAKAVADPPKTPRAPETGKN
jgi:uncharacterized membrane protein